MIYILMIQIRISNHWLKNVSITRRTNVFRKHSPQFHKYFHFQNGKFTSQFSFQFVLKFENCIYNWLAAKLWSFGTKPFVYPKNNPDRSMTFPQKCSISSDSSHNNPHCNPNTVFQRYPHLSKVFDHPLNDKALKKYNTLASQHYSLSELLFLTAQSSVSFRKHIIGILPTQFLNLFPMLKLPLLQNLLKIFLYLNMLLLNQPISKKRFDLTEQNEIVIEPYRAIASDLCDSEIL